MIHNPKLCSVCKRLGDFDVTTCTTEFFSEHEDKGIYLSVTSIGEVVEIGFNKRIFLMEAKALLNALQATGEPGRITQHLVDLKSMCHKALKGTR